MVADPSLLPRRQFVRLKGAASVRQGCGGTGAAIVAVLAIKSGKSGTNTTVGSSLDQDQQSNPYFEAFNLI